MTGLCFLTNAEHQENHDSAREASISFNLKATNCGRDDQPSPHLLNVSPNGRMSEIIDYAR